MMKSRISTRTRGYSYSHLQAPLKKPAISLTLMDLLKALPAAIGLIALFMGILIFVSTHNIQVPHWLGEGFSPLAAIDNLFGESPFEASLWLLLLMFLATLVHDRPCHLPRCGFEMGFD